MGSQPGEVLTCQLHLLTRADLAADTQDTEWLSIPSGRVLAGEPAGIEAVDRNRSVHGRLDVEHRVDGEDVHDAAVAPRPAVQGDRLDEQRKGYRHPDGTGHRQVRIGPRAEVVDEVVLDVPDRRVGRSRQFAERAVAEVMPVEGLQLVAAQQAGP